MLLQGIGAQQWPHQSVQDKAQRSSLSFRFVHGTVTGAAVVSFPWNFLEQSYTGDIIARCFAVSVIQNFRICLWASGTLVAQLRGRWWCWKCIDPSYWDFDLRVMFQANNGSLLFYFFSFFFFFFLELQQHWVCLYLVNMDFEHTYVTSVAVPVLHGPLFPKDLRLSGGSHEIFFFFFGVEFTVMATINC